MSESKSGLVPVLVNPSPQLQEAAVANLFAFSDEGRAQNAKLESTEGLMEITKIPRMRKCFDCIRLTGEEVLSRLPRMLRPPRSKIDKIERSIDPAVTYTALVYEFVEPGANDPVVAQELLDFLWRVGFGHVPVTKADNWESGVLLDHSDIVHATGKGWRADLFGHRTVDRILRWPSPS